MTIDSKKIWGMSAQDYVGPSNKVTDLYHVIGIHCENKNFKDFMKLVPEDAEIVVDYRHEFATRTLDFEPLTNNPIIFNHQWGEALIPKTRTPKEKK